MYINLELYRVFYETAKNGNVTKAADKLCVSQSAVSQAIKQLEGRLDQKLFDRNARGVKLTPEGEVLFSYANNAVSLMENAQEKLENMRNLNEGAIKIGASDTICSVILLRLLKKFNIDYPEIKISVMDSSTLQSIVLIKNGAVDLSFVTLPVEADPAVEIFPIIPIHDCFVAGERYAGLINSKMELSDLKNYPLLMMEKSGNSRKQIDRFLLKNNLEIEPAIEFASLGLLPKFAKEGLGIAVTIKEDVFDMLESGELFEVQFTKKPPVRHIALAQMKNITLSSAAQAFKNALLEWSKINQV